MQEVLELYVADATLPFRQIKVHFVGESGDDWGGLTKDLFTSLWSQLLMRFFRGESAMVPFIPVHEHMSKRRYYEAVGRILSHTAALLGYIPARISRCTLICLALDAGHVNDNLLLADLR